MKRLCNLALFSLACHGSIDLTNSLSIHKNTKSHVKNYKNHHDHHQVSNNSVDNNHDSKILYNYHRTDELNTSRRKLLQKTFFVACVASTTCTPSSSSAAVVAMEGEDSAIIGGGTTITTKNTDDVDISKQKRQPRKPFAPLGALLPATRVKFDIQDCIDIANQLVVIEDTRNNSSNSSSRNSNGNYDEVTLQAQKDELVAKMKTILLDKKSYMTINSQTPGNNISSSSSTTTTSTSDKKDNSKSNQEEYQIPKKRSGSKMYQEVYQEKIQNLSPVDVPLAMLTQFGESRSAAILKRRQSRLEEANAIRAAFNYYTSKIQFDTEYYQLNASKEDRKRMIRNDALPSVQSVIVSDLDLRDLSRNQVLDSWDEAQAEFKYQVSKSTDDFSAGELLSLLTKAQNYCNEWFSFIPEDDIKEADQFVMKENNVNM